MKMAAAGIEVRRSNPSVATIWVAELLAATKKQDNELENKRTHESIQEMFGKICPSSTNSKLSLEEILCNKIAKQKKKNVEKEKDYHQMVMNTKKRKKEFSKTEVNKMKIISDKQKALELMDENQTQMIPELKIENLKSQLQDQSISRSARKKLKRKLKELQNDSEVTGDNTTSTPERKKHKANTNSSPVEKNQLNLTNNLQPEIPIESHNHEKSPKILTKNEFKSNPNLSNTQQNKNIQSPLKKSKLAQKIKMLTELLKKKRKKRSKQKNIKKDNRPESLKLQHLKIKREN